MLPKVRDLLMGQWIEHEGPLDPPRAGEGLMMTDTEIDQLMDAIHNSYAFRRWVLSMEWAHLKTELRKAFAPVVEAWRRENRR